MKHEGRGVIRKSDRTDHGGQVIGASSGTVVMGLVAALEGDMTFCPRCKGSFAIKTDRVGAKHEGKHYAYHGDVAECGARLLTSLSSQGSESSGQSCSGTSAAEPSANASTRQSAQDESAQGTSATRHFDDRFVLIDDETGNPLAQKEYGIRRANGQVEFGTTDVNGVTHLLTTVVEAESVEIFT